MPTKRKKPSAKPTRQKSSQIATSLREDATALELGKESLSDSNPILETTASAAATNIIFQPNEGPQTKFLSSTEQEVLYGGAAGGGKSYAMLADPIRYHRDPEANMLLVRRSTEELRELIGKSKSIYPKVDPGAKWRERDKTWVFSSGAQLWMSYLDKDDDVLRYQGQAFTWIGFDELTQWPTPTAWNYMRSRLRDASTGSGKVYMRATTNPGGPGHSWVKKMFVDPSSPNKGFPATDVDTGEELRYPEFYQSPHPKAGQPHPKAGKELFKRKFIPASLYDNPYLADTGYEANLLSMPEHLRKQLLEGDWDVNEGAAFPEFNRKKHVIEPFSIPSSWPKFRACDYGYGSYTGVVWFAVAPSGQLIVYRELYVSKMLAADLATHIVDIERNSGERMRYGVLDSSLWHRRGDTGPSLAEQMINRGCRWRPSDRSAGSRVAGKNELHRKLQGWDHQYEQPDLVFFSTCTNLIAQLPSIPLDKKNPEDVDTKSEDHLYDALRYGIMSRPSGLKWDIATPRDHGPTVLDETFGY